MFPELGSSSSTSSSSSPTSASIASTSATATPASSTSISNTTSSNKNESGSNTEAIIGAAVGVPLGLAALAGLFLFWRESNKRKQIEGGGQEKITGDYLVGYGGQGQGPGGGGDGYREGGQETVEQAPVIKRYEMEGQQEVELPADRGNYEVGIGVRGALPLTTERF
ncbi:hypothetical protein EG329_011818 [Mollisiaceae sp. DMI_Dod_QoI]|nr:hypothetical protein EG329_011818 [Helotiales sp. DMI_Dod_QoI]